MAADQIEVCWDGTQVRRVPSAEQLEVLDAMAHGIPVQHIARRLKVSDDIIYRRTRSAMGVMGTASTTQTLYEVYRFGYLPNPWNPNFRPVLTGRQTAILELTGRLGLTNAQVATRMDIAGGTVEAHFKNVFNILGAKTRPHALRLAVIRGDIRIPSVPQVWRGVV